MVGFVSASFDAFVATTLAVSIPWLYYTLRQDGNPQQRRSKLKTSISIFLLLHTLYILHELILSPPPNFFTALNLPANTPSDTIRAILLHHADDGELPQQLEALLTKLGAFDMRTLYIRFGHNVLAACEYCRSYEDYALFALPRPLLSYIREMAVVGVITLKPTGRSHLRSFGVGALIVAAVAEIYNIVTATVTISPRGSNEPVFMLHDSLLKARLVLFLLLPLLIQYLPTLIPPTIRIPIISPIIHPPPSLTPEQRANLLQSTLRTLDHLLPSLHLLKYTRASFMRLPSIRNRAASWWDQEKKEGTIIAEDEGVKKAARAEGLSYDQAHGESDEGKLRSNAKAAIEAMKTGAIPSEHWR